MGLSRADSYSGHFDAYHRQCFFQVHHPTDKPCCGKIHSSCLASRLLELHEVTALLERKREVPCALLSAMTGCNDEETADSKAFLGE